MDNKLNTLSIVMPALNEESNVKDSIINSLDAMKKHRISGELIVINDGSTDKTREVVEELMMSHPNVRLINHEKPWGIGGSFMDGVKHSQMDVVVMFPGDNENNPDSALEFFHLANHVDVIVPFIANVEIRNRFRRIVSSLYRLIINISFGVTFNYTNGTVFYRRSVITREVLKSHGFFYQAELLIRIIRKGYLFAEVPNIMYERKVGQSKAIRFRSLIHVMKGYLRLLYDIHICRSEAKNFADQSISREKFKNLYFQ